MSELRIRAAQNDEEMQLANDLMAKVHEVDYFRTLDWLQNAGVSYPGFRREHVRLALWKGEMAGALRVNIETIRLGEARLRMGGFGWVTTTPRHRNKGIARALMEDTKHYMRELGCHVSMLFGIPNFYDRFGFTTSLSDYACVVHVAALDTVPRPEYRVRAGKPGDIRAVQRIHNANDTDTACSIVRSAAHITNQWENLWKALQVVTDARGSVTGYFVPRIGNDELVLDEAGVSSPDACDAVLSACAARATEALLPRIRLRAPPSHPLSRHLLAYKSTHEMRVDRNGRGMMAFIGLGETLESLIPEWESRLQDHAARDYRTEVTLFADGVPWRVRANRGALDVANTPGKNKFSVSAAQLMHLLTGYRVPDDIYPAQRRIITAEGRRLLGVLFPRRNPYVWPLDLF